MKDYVISTDNNADLPEWYQKKHGLEVVYLSYSIDGESYQGDDALPVEQFYARMRAGSMPTTAQVNPDDAKALFERCLKKTDRILHIAFSSGLSGTYNSMCIAAAEVMEERPGCEIVVLDSKAASLGQGLIVHKALLMQEQEKSMEEVIDWLNENMRRLVHVFTVDDLNHLHRGGRVSKAAAVLGTMIHIKPILHVDDEGRLVPIDKVRGRKKSLHMLVDHMQEHVEGCLRENDIVFISHGDAEADAAYVAELVKQRFGIESALLNHVGPTIGAHSGPGTIALFFLGNHR